MAGSVDAPYNTALFLSYFKCNSYLYINIEGRRVTLDAGPGIGLILESRLMLAP